MFYVKGKTAKLGNDLLSGYRCIYYTGTDGGDAEGFDGMSGSPMVDSNGYVIGIFLGKYEEEYRQSIGEILKGICISFDSWLYQKLKSYE